MKGIVNYEGHKFNPWECSGWNFTETEHWLILVGTYEESRNFYTKIDPTIPGGLFDKINKAKKEIQEMKDN